MKKIIIEESEIEISSKGLLIIPNGVKNILENAFKDCVELTSIEIPEGVSIRFNAFKGCIKLSNIKLSKGVSIGRHAFADCSGLSSIEIPEGVSIGSSAFYNCAALISIKISEGVSIGEHAFAGCIGLSSVKISKNVFIENHAFSGCIGLTCIEISKNVSIKSYVFSNCKKLSDFKILERVSIAEHAFYNCSLASIEVSKSAHLKRHAFSGCNNLASIVVSADQDLSMLGLNSGVKITRRPYYFIPRLPKCYRFDWDSSTFGIGKKLTTLVLLCLHRNWSMKSQSLGLPPEMALSVLSFMNVQVSERMEKSIPENKELAEDVLKPVKVIEAFQKDQDFNKNRRTMPEDRVTTKDTKSIFNMCCTLQ